MLEPIAADVPVELWPADDAMTRFGRWSTQRRGGAACGSAEGMYRPPRPEGQGGPVPLVMSTLEAMRVQRCLARVREVPRFVLKVLYVPHRVPAVVQLRRAGIRPRESCVHHVEGLRELTTLLQSAPMLTAGSSGPALSQAGARVEQAQAA